MSTHWKDRPGSSVSGPCFLLTRRQWCAVGFVVLVLTTMACEARRADRAYRRGDYEKAFKEQQYLAEAGDIRAQYDLGVMYDTGQGVPQSDEEALKWYKLAAKQGEGRAQYNLGLMYMNGQGVPQDYVEAYLWISLSAAQGNQHAMDARDYVDEKMTVEQRVRAKQLVRDYERAKRQAESCTMCSMVEGRSSP